MEMFKKYHIVFFVLVLSMANCKKQISTAAINAPNNYLVVNGNISVNGITTIGLSRTVNISGNVNSKPELNASITLEGSQGGSYPLVSNNNGNYVSAPLNLSLTQTYRLKIVTGDGKQYQSDFVPVKNAPPIDTINYVIQNKALQINVNTHDAINSTHYYRWDYIETYIIHSEYVSNYMVVNRDTTAPRPPDQQVYQCWISDTSSTIVLGSSAKLSKDIISSLPVIAIPFNSEKGYIRYSILVKQYALTSDAYNYFTLLKKNTEQLGGIFDAQPSGLTGNIHCISNPAEPVIGYITAGSISEQRIFIDNKNLPGWATANSTLTCSVDTLLYVRWIPVKNGTPYPSFQVRDLIYSGVETPIDIVGSYPAGGFTAAFAQCVDCTLRGTNKQPIFWK